MVRSLLRSFLCTSIPRISGCTQGQWSCGATAATRYCCWVGTLRYDRSLPAIELPDRVLQHLHIVIARKLREQQRIAINIISEKTEPMQVWVDARIPILITYATGVASTINQKWLAELEATFSAAGLVLIPEPSA
jgi:hypothetical protein